MPENNEDLPLTNQAHRPVRIIQLASALVQGSAISLECIEIDRRLRRLGFQTSIFAARSDAYGAQIAMPYSAYRAATGDLVLLHYGEWSEVADLVLRINCPYVLIYHNVTPSTYFSGLDVVAAVISDIGERKLPELAHQCRIAIAKSEYSRQYLLAKGFREVEVIPFLLDLERLAGESDGALSNELAQSSCNILAVGRIVPNKRIDSLIKVAFALTQSMPEVRLHIVGTYDPNGRYYRWLRDLIGRLEIAHVVCFAGQVPDTALRTYYRGSQIYLSMSEHEGFCVPLVEAMHVGLPIIARASAAVPETVDDAGILVHSDRPSIYAAIIRTMMSNDGLYRRLAARGQARSSFFNPDRIERNLTRILLAAYNRPIDHT